MNITNLSIIDLVTGSGYKDDPYNLTDFTTKGDYSIRFTTTGKGVVSFNVSDLVQTEVAFVPPRPLRIAWFVNGVLFEMKGAIPDGGLSFKTTKDDVIEHRIQFVQNEDSYSEVRELNLFLNNEFAPVELPTVDNSLPTVDLPAVENPEVNTRPTGIRVATIDIDNCKAPHRLEVSPSYVFEIRDNEIWYTGDLTQENSYMVRVKAIGISNEVLTVKGFPFKVTDCDRSPPCGERCNGERPIDHSLTPPTLNVSNNGCVVDGDGQTWINYLFSIATNESNVAFDIQTSRGNTFNLIEENVWGVTLASFVWSLRFADLRFVRVRVVNRNDGSASRWSNTLTIQTPTPQDCENDENFEPEVPPTVDIPIREQVGNPELLEPPVSPGGDGGTPGSPGSNSTLR